MRKTDLGSYFLDFCQYTSSWQQGDRALKFQRRGLGWGGGGGILHNLGQQRDQKLRNQSRQAKPCPPLPSTLGPLSKKS